MASEAGSLLQAINGFVQTKNHFLIRRGGKISDQITLTEIHVNHLEQVPIKEHVIDVQLSQFLLLRIRKSQKKFDSD